MSTSDPQENPDGDPPRLDPQPLITYRYLRMGLVALLVMLFASVVLQTITDDWHWQPSISDYYWTPARNVFVGALVALGFGMIVMKPDSELEDVALNLAGGLAPVVAFVPTPAAGTCRLLPGGGLSPPSADTVAGIENNVPAYFVAGAVSVVMLLALTRLVPDRVPFPPLTPKAKLGRSLGFVALLGIFAYAVVWYRHDQEAFQCEAHLRAAFVMFGFMILVVLVNAIGKARTPSDQHPSSIPAWLNVYTVIFALMLLGLAVAAVLRNRDWDYWVLFAEAVELGLFLLFWIIQSIELWNRGLRSPQSEQRDLLPQP